MPFSINVREEALVACGRHCCLCRRFVGTKIECHHIVPESQGGDDSFGNCLPLCFDCHADVQHYNPEHPKGTRFRPSELLAHRDAWFARISRTTPAIFDEERREIDRATFQRFREQLPEEEMRELLAEQCWGQSFPSATRLKIFEIDRFLERLDSEFLDPTCEGYRSNFFEAYRKFWNNNDFTQISPLKHDFTRYRLPKEWTESGDPQVRLQFFDCMNNLNKLSTEAFDAYQTMIREVRRLLIVP